jgi:hypothetical protein
MKNFLRKAAVGAAVAGAPVLAMAQSSSDPLSAASSQIATWSPIIAALLVAAFGITVFFRGSVLAKRGIKAV